MLMAGDLDMGHARALLAVDAANQIALANQVAAKRLSVRETEQLVVRIGREFALSPGKKSRTKPRDLVRLEEELSDLMATEVTLKSGARGNGQVIIHFADLDQLDGIIARLRGGSPRSD